MPSRKCLATRTAATRGEYKADYARVTARRTSRPLCCGSSAELKAPLRASCSSHTNLQSRDTASDLQLVPFSRPHPVELTIHTSGSLPLSHKP